MWELPGLATFRYTISEVFLRAATASSCRTSCRLVLFTWEGEGRGKRALVCSECLSKPRDPRGLQSPPAWLSFPQWPL